MASRDGAVARALAFFDGNGFRDRLADLVAIPSTSQDPATMPMCNATWTMRSVLGCERLGFTVAIHPNPRSGFGPILTAERHRGPHAADRSDLRPRRYGSGLEDQWHLA